MKIDVFIQDGTDENDYRTSLVIKVDGKREVGFFDGEPEDNSLSRNFCDVFAIPKLMQRAYAAGKAGEEFTVETHQEED